MDIIRSTKNEKVKQWKKLLTKKERDKTGLFLIEGEHLVQEANKQGIIQELIVTEQMYPKLPKATFGRYQTAIIENSIAKVLSDTETPQGIFAVCKQIVFEKVEGTRFLLLDRVQDPGNAGTIIRTADAAGMDAVIFGEGSVDLYNPKLVRSTQGSLFHLPVVKGNLTEWIQRLKEKQIPIYGSALQKAVSMYNVAPTESYALLVGNEAQGVHPDLLKETDANLYIPIYGKSESLNVSVATGILLYYLRGAQI